MIEPMSIEAIFTDESRATGGGRQGHVKSATGRIDLETRKPTEMGGDGDGTNPEELFSAAYAACFLGALRAVAGKSNVGLDDATEITAKVGIGNDPAGGFGLTGTVIGYLPGLQQDAADQLVQQAHQACPYSKAIRGNVDVAVSARV